VNVATAGTLFMAGTGFVGATLDLENGAQLGIMAGFGILCLSELLYCLSEPPE
jgi:hypothetical protein